MFKILVLQALYNLSDDQTEFQVRDRLSFMRFLGLGLDDRVPDAKAIWLFRELLVRAGGDRDAVRDLRRSSSWPRLSGDVGPAHRCLDRGGAEATEHRRREGRTQGGGGSRGMDGEARQAAPEGPGRALDDEARPRSTAGRRPAQGAGDHGPAFGYKNHIATDRRHGLIRKWTVTHAAANDGRQLPNLIDPENTTSPVWADTAYRSRRNEGFLAKHGLVSMIHFRKPPKKVMPEPKKKANATRSKVRSAIEHVFAHQKGPMNLSVRTVGLARARIKIGMANLAYNIRRLVWLQGRTAPA